MDLEFHYHKKQVSFRHTSAYYKSRGKFCFRSSIRYSINELETFIFICDDYVCYDVMTSDWRFNV